MSMKGLIPSDIEEVDLSALEDLEAAKGAPIDALLNSSSLLNFQV